MIRLMHQLASAKQAASGRPQLGNAAHAASPPGDCASTDLVDAVYRSEVTYLTLSLVIAPRIPHPLATVAAWRKRGTLLAGTIPLPGVILEHFRTKQVDEKFDL